uniref:ATP synthase subunit delta, chloroplastic n=1 Tax=Hommersandiophycus borowitzkae TaxID=268573 RepID=A0A1G4NUD1_9FLOR|nr:ATP synthase CF1 subunit delta [Hommersandiophycus borowitzkae]SCW22156.1 ATP synthase CF1 subunit delta [Hommersandiophycus borowitzkae]
MSTKTLIQQLSQPYAEALLEVARKSEQMDKIKEDVNIVLQVLAESNNLVAFLNNPLVSLQSKKEAVIKLFGDQLSNEVVVFILLLIDRKRIFYISAILNRYLEFLYEFESFIIADVATSNNLTDQQKKTLVDKLKDITGKNNIQLNVSIDKSLIAGFTIQIGSKIIDTSLRGQLKDIGYFLGANNI